MERDMDLIRELLLRIAGNPKLDGTKFHAFEPPDELGEFSQEEINYHIDLLFEAGYVKGNSRSESPLVSKLTWDGHEFVDNIRDNGIWKSVKKRIEPLQSVAISVVAQVALAEVKRHLHLPT